MRRGFSGAIGGAWLVLAGACSDPGADPPPAAGSSGDSAASSSDDGADTTAGEPPPSACAEPTEVVGAPETMGEAVAFIDALPRPVTLDCVLERFARPLPINATSSTVSLQPAVGSGSPRVFLFYGPLIMSVAVDGDGRQLLEFGELVSDTQSIKGELEFPIEGPLQVVDATEGVLDETGTKCRLCHGHEEPSPVYEKAFVSDALRFREDEEQVLIEDLRLAYEACDPIEEPERCARLDALFGFGEVIEVEFPDTLQTIYDYGG